jgi:hypothetical protein
MRFTFGLLVALLVAWAAAEVLFGGALKLAPESGLERRAAPSSAGPLGVGWTIADTRLLFEANHYACGYVTHEAFEFDEVTSTATVSTHGTAFADIADTATVPTARRRSVHAPADYLWCDLGNVPVAGVDKGRGESVRTRDIFVSVDGRVAEFLTDTQPR